MRLIILALCLTACAEDKPKGPVCVKEFNLIQHQYSDGQIRKSEKTVCSNGCTTYSSMDPSPVSESSCN